MKIAKLLTAWRVDAQPPSYKDLLEVRDEQKELIDALVALANEPQPLGIVRSVYQSALSVIAKHEAQA